MTTSNAPAHCPTYLDNEFRQVFRNLCMRDRVAGMDPERWVKYCKRNGATTVFMDFRSQYYAYHPSKFIPKDPVLGDRDLAGELAAAARKHGLKFCAYIPPGEVESLEHGHDDWQQRTADGGMERRNWGPTKRTVFCYNTGYGELFANHLREISERYRPHGFYIDGMIFGFGACYCATCKAKFKAETGQAEMPTQPDWNSPLWHAFLDWRYRQVEGIARLAGTAIHGVDPRIAIVWNSGFFATGWQAAQSPAQAAWLDFAGSEIYPSFATDSMFQDGYTYAEELAWGISACRSAKYGRWGQHYTYFTPATRRGEVIATANVISAFGAEGCAQEHCRYLGDFLGRIAAVEPWLKDSVSAADVALHYSRNAQLACFHPDTHGDVARCLRDVKGLYKALLNSHVPTEIVTDEWLEQGDLSPFRAIVLPNSAHLSETAAATLQAYVRAGGALIASMETGLRDRLGKRGKELLWPDSGLTFRAEIKTPQASIANAYPDRMPVMLAEVPADPDQFLMFGAKAAMKAWIGEDITLGHRPDGVERREMHQFAGEPSVHVSAKALDIAADGAWKTLLTMRFRRDRANGFESCPAVVTRKLGHGRIVYVNFPIGEQAARFSTMTGPLAGHPWWRRFAARLVEVAAGLPRVRIEAPTCVKSALWKQPALNRYALHLVNELSSVGVRSVQREDVVPVPVRVTLALPNISKVRVVIGGKGSRVRRAGKTWTVDFKGLGERAVIECAQE